MLQWGGSEVGVDHMAGLLVQVAHPACKLAGVGQRGGQEHHAHAFGQKDDGLFPYHPPLPVLHVVHLVKDDPCNFPQQL